MMARGCRIPRFHREAVAGLAARENHKTVSIVVLASPSAFPAAPPELSGSVVRHTNLR